jgi:hypothetical protein
MVRHNDNRVNVGFDSVIVQTRTENDIASILRQNPALIGTEGEEVRFEIALEMGKDAAVEGFGHRKSKPGFARPDSRGRLSLRGSM